MKESKANASELTATRLLTLPEVARYLQVHEKTVQRWIATRGLPCVRLGARLRFDAGDVLRWLAGLKEGG